MTRLERHLRKSPGQKSLGPRIGDDSRDMNPFTARDADADLVVLEDIPTVNLGRGVPDPTPGGVSEPSFSATDRNFAVAAMSGGKKNTQRLDPIDAGNPNGYFPMQYGPMWKNTNFTALNVAPRSRRNVAPASINGYLHAEWTEGYWDAVKDETGVWNVPPPPEMEVERAIYDALKRETVDVGGYGVPFPKYPKPENYGEYVGATGDRRRYLRPSLSFPMKKTTGEKVSWRDGDPLYHGTPTGLLPKILKEGLVGDSDRWVWLATTPSAWNDEFPIYGDFRKVNAKGMSMLRISPTDEMNEAMGKIAGLMNDGVEPGPGLGMVVVDENGESVSARDFGAGKGYASASNSGTAIFKSVVVPPENIEVLNQRGQWIPIAKADFSDIIFDSPKNEEVEAGMSFDKRSIMRMVNDITSRKKDKEEREEPRRESPAQEPTQIVLGLPRQQPRIGYSDSYGGDDVIKREQRMQRIEHEGMAGSGMWREIHSDHYDWWAYPIDRGSAAYGETFNVAGEPLGRLRNDPEFLSSLAREIEIQALALGWSLREGKFLDELDWEKGQDWRKTYPTRFWKMTRSAQIFGLEEEFESLLVLRQSLEDAGINFNHSTYWANPGTVDDVPPIDSAYQKRTDTARFPASDSASWTDPFWQPLPRNESVSPSASPTETDEEKLIYDAYDNFQENFVFPTLSDAEELADLLSEPDDVIEFGYPYEKIPKEDRQTIADDIYFAISLLMDGVFPDEEKTDRIESAAQMRKYANEVEGLYPDDGDILYSLADVLEDPELLNDEAIVSEDTEAGMARRMRALDEGISSDDLSLDDPEIQNLIESESDAATEDFLLGRSVSRIIYPSSDFPKKIPKGTPQPVRQFSLNQEIPEEILAEFALLWGDDVPFVDITERMNLSPEDAVSIQTELFRSGRIASRTRSRESRTPIRLSPENEDAFIQWHREGASRELLESIFELTPSQYASIVNDLRKRRLIATRIAKQYFSDDDVIRFNSIRERAIKEGGPLNSPTATIKQTIMREMNLDETQYILLKRKAQYFRQNPERVAESIGNSLSESADSPETTSPSANNFFNERDIRRFAEMYNDEEFSGTIRRSMNMSEGDYRRLYIAAKRRGLITPRPLKGTLRGPTKTTIEDFERFVQLYNDGNKRSEIMNEMGISATKYGTLYASARKSGRVESPLVTRTNITQEQLDAFVSEWNAGSSLQYIVKQQKLTLEKAKSIFRKARSMGLVRPRNRGRKRQPRFGTEELFTQAVDMFSRLYAEGQSKLEIRKRMRLSKSQYANIYKWAKRRNLITSRPPGRPRRNNISSVAQPQETSDDTEAGMSSALVKRATDEDAQIDLLYSVPAVSGRLRMLGVDGSPIAIGRNSLMKPYFLAPHVDVNKMDPSDPVMQLLSPALKRAGLGSYPVDGHVVPKIQGPVVRDFADRFVGPMAVANAVSGTFPSADEMLTIYAINALIRARAEFLSDSTMTADQVNTAILNGVQVGRRLDGGDDMGGSLWKPGRNSARSSDLTTNTRPDGGDYEPRFSGTIDPFAYFTGRSDFLWSVIDAMPESVKSKLAPHLTKRRHASSWEDVSFFEDIEIREDDKVSRNLAPMVRSQAESAIRHAREHQNITRKWAQTAYDLMRESGLNDDEIAHVINEHWVVAAGFPLDSVRPGSVLGAAARLGVKAFSARYSPITKVDGRGEEEDYGLHEFFHHYLGQGFTRHGEYVAFRGPMDVSDSYHGHLQWAWNVHGQLGMFVSKVMREVFGRPGDPRADEASALQGESEVIFNSISRAIYDRLKSMLASPDEKMAIFAQVFPELIDADSEDEAKIKELIRRQFAVRARVGRFFNENIPVLRLMTAKDFLVPREYWPYGGASKILYEETT